MKKRKLLTGFLGLIASLIAQDVENTQSPKTLLAFSEVKADFERPRSRLSPHHDENMKHLFKLVYGNL